MGQVFGLIGELIPLALGSTLLIYFGGIITPKFKDSESELKYIKKKKKMIIIAIILIVIGLFGLIKMI